MNPGLAYLLRKKPVGWFRSVRRRARGAKGALLIFGAILFAVFLIGPQILVAMQMNDEAMAEGLERVRRWGPPVLTIMALMGTTSGRGLLFKPNEIDFLFPAPIGRRDLLLYFVLGRLLVIALSSLWISVFTLRWAVHWYAGIVGIFGGLSFLLLLSLLSSLLLSTVSERLTQRVRRIAGLSLLALVGGGLWLVKRQLPSGAGMADAARELAESSAVVVAAAPARVFVEVFASETAGQFAVWGAAGFAILLALFGAIVLLDVAYTESAVRTSRQIQARLQRARAGGSAFAVGPSGKARFSLPALPWFGGAGPIAWRQGIEALRNVRGIVFTSVFTIAIPLLVVGTSMSGDLEGNGDRAGRSTVPALVMIIMMTVFMNQNLALDFRRDLDRMAYLKSLPLPASAVALGQIVAGIVVFTLLQTVAISVLVLGLGVSLPMPAAMLLLLLPFNWLAQAVDNVLFLLYPYRFAPKEAGSFQFMGRTMMVAFAKMLALLLLCGAAGVAGWLGWTFAGESLLVAGIAAGGVLSVAATVLTMVLGRVFTRFDVTRNVPG